MWFVFVAVGLAAVAVSGLYARRRLTQALVELGVREGRVRVVRWVMAWLLFGAPVVVIVSIAVSVMLGRETLPRFDGPFGAWLLTLPFAWTMLVVLQSVPWLLAADVAYLGVRRWRGRRSALRLRTIAVLAVLGVFAVYTPARILVERGELRVREHRVGVATPTASTPFRIAFVADVQQDEFTDGARAREVYAIVNRFRPDVVLSGGDWINAGPEHIRAAAEAAGELTSRLGTYTVRGDHEHFAYVDQRRSAEEVEQALRAHRVETVSGAVRWFEHAGKRIGVVFLDHNYIHRTDASTIASLVSRVENADYSILVTHQLDRALAEQVAGRVDLVLAAHTHGGQVNPVVGITHVELARLETKYIDGRYQLGSTTIIVTAGVGYSIVPFRYAAPASIEIIDVIL